MPINLHDATVRACLQVLPSVLSQIDKAQAWCAAKGLPDSALTEARLAPDMWAFSDQIRSIVWHSAGAVTAVKTGTFAPQFVPAPTDFASLRSLVEGAIADLQATTPEQIEAAATADAAFQVGDRRMEFTGADYLLSFALPNFWFHATTAYAILRAQGVEVGKRDFLGAVRFKTPPQM